MFLYYIIFILSIFSLYLSTTFCRYRTYIFYLFALLLALIAGLRGSNIDNDYLVYAYNFKDMGTPLNYFKNYSLNYFYEPLYYLIPSIFNHILNIDLRYVFLLFATLGVLLKFKAILKLTSLPFLSVAIYTIHFYLLHEFTQIRTGIASALLLLCVVEIYERNLVRFISLTLFALCFHYMAIFIFPLYFLKSGYLKKKLFYAYLIIPFIFYLLRINIFSILTILNLGIFSEKLTFYQDLLAEGLFDKINVFNIITILQVIFCFILIYKSDYLATKNKYALLLIKIYTLSQALFVFFSSMPVLSFRIGGFFEITQIVTLPLLLYIFKEKYVALSFILLFCLLLLTINLFHSHLLKPYFY